MGLFRPSRRWFEYGFAAAVVAACTGVSFLMFPFFELTNLVMVYLLGTLSVAARGRRGPAAFASIASVLCFDFFFVPPRFTFVVSDVQYVWTFLVMFAAAMITSHLVILLREKARLAEEATERNLFLFEKAKKAEVEIESERMKNSFLSSVSHDFRTPLAAIVGSVGALLGKEELRKNAAVRELLENIQSEGEGLARLVQKLLEVTRLESGAVSIKKELCPLEEVVGSALERLEKPLAGRKIEVKIPEDLPLVPMDEVLLEQVFVNLVENALRHAAGGGIEISARREAGSVAVAVMDEGAGLGSGELERVFDKFYHGRASTGAGLGLAICRAVVNAHGGRIWAENRPKGGAAFRFTLPL